MHSFLCHSALMRRMAWIGLALSLSACQSFVPSPSRLALPPPLEHTQEPSLKPIVPEGVIHWQGRMSIEVQSQPAQKLYGPFELVSELNMGQLRLMGPLGTVAAELTWNEAGATLKSTQLHPPLQHYPSLKDLTLHWLGSELDFNELISALNDHTSHLNGWLIESERSQTKVATRNFPAPRITVKLILDED